MMETPPLFGDDVVPPASDPLLDFFLREFSTPVTLSRLANDWTGAMKDEIAGLDQTKQATKDALKRLNELVAYWVPLTIVRDDARVRFSILCAQLAAQVLPNHPGQFWIPMRLALRFTWRAWLLEEATAATDPQDIKAFRVLTQAAERLDQRPISTPLSKSSSFAYAPTPGPELLLQFELLDWGALLLQHNLSPEISGRFVPKPAAELDPDDERLRDYTYETFIPDPGAVSEQLAAKLQELRLRVYPTDAPALYLEKTERPDGSVSLSLRGLESNPTSPKIKKALGGRCVVELARGKTGGGPKEISRKEARARLLKLADQADSNGDPIEPYNLSKYTTRSPRTISYWLERAEWGLEDLRIALRRFRRRQSARKSSS